MQQIVSLNPGNSQRVSFLIAPNAEAEYTVELDGLIRSFKSFGATGEFYLPFGGIRLAVCTTWKPATPITRVHMDGDIATYNTLPEPDPGEGISPTYQTKYAPIYGCFDTPNLKSDPATPEDYNSLVQGEPLEWNPPMDAISWEVLEEPEKYRIFVYLASYYGHCPPYWETREELAKAIGRAHLHQKVCGGAPYYSEYYYHHYLTSGIANEEKEIHFGHQLRYANVEPYDYILCPYCEQRIRNYEIPFTRFSICDRTSGDLILGRKLLEHIETEHPNHPLTEPAWW